MIGSKILSDLIGPMYRANAKSIEAASEGSTVRRVYMRAFFILINEPMHKRCSKPYRDKYEQQAASFCP
jgi:hypothetical protein